MKIIECVQGSEEWFEARHGKITGTGFSKVMAKDKRNKALRTNTPPERDMKLSMGCRSWRSGLLS
jgi:hypothetical protein